MAGRTVQSTGIGIGAVGGAALALKAATPLALKFAGFYATGPAAGSFAASWMSSVAAGGGVSAGSAYAACQSAAMGGGALLGAPVLIGVAAGVAGVGYGGYCGVNWGVAKIRRYRESPSTVSVSTSLSLLEASGCETLELQTKIPP